jgi:hypothetical protein
MHSMEIAGVDVSPGTAAQLAALLSRAGNADLAMRVGLAVDMNMTLLRLSAGERSQIRQTLMNCTTALVPLRDGLAV